MVAFPNAKINIGLHIINQRPDGFHNIETCFLPIAWTDVLEIIESKTDSFSSSGLEIKGEIDSNLCLKALHLLKKDFAIPPVAIHLHKTIPMGGGLGGGSSDAAFVLKLLNEKFSLQITNELLTNYARKLGSDCAFFLENKPVFATQKGDYFENIVLQLSNYQIFVVYPDIHVSTANAYAEVVPRLKNTDLKSEILKPIETWKNTIFNDFEISVFRKFPKIDEIKQKMYEKGAIYAAMSGSGSAVFGIFEKNKVVIDFKNFTTNTTKFI